jgi:hypothetical protein
VCPVYVLGFGGSVVTLPDRFGLEYRRAVFTRTSTARARALAWVLVNEAYAHRSRTVELGYLLLRRETLLDGWNLERARDELVDAGLLTVVSRGSGRSARTNWTLENVRPRADEKNVRSNVRSGADTHSLSLSHSPLGPPKGGTAHELIQTSQPSTNHRRRRLSRAERIDDFLARHPEEEE